MAITWFVLLTLVAGFPEGRQQDPVPAAPAPGLAAAEAPAAEVDVRFEGALRGVRDGEDFLETAGHRRLLDILSRYGPEELRGKFEAHLDMKAALADPAAWRGRIVRVRGVIAGLTTERFEAPLGGREDFYRAVVWDGESATVVDFLEPPPPLTLQRDLVEMEGVFFRTVSFTSKKDEVRATPYVIGRGVRHLDPETLTRSTGLDTFAKILCGIGSCLIVVRVVSTLRKSRRSKSRKLDSSIRERAARVSRPHPLPHKS